MSELRKIDYDKDFWKTQKIVKLNGVWAVEGRPTASREIKQQVTPSNIPGKTFIASLLTYPPDCATPPHNHNGAAVFAEVLKGRVISQMIHLHTVTKSDGSVEVVEHDSGPNIYGPGDTWYEAPGCHHVRVENPFDEEAQFFTNFVIDTQKIEEAKSLGEALTIYDAAVEEEAKKGGS